MTNRPDPTPGAITERDDRADSSGNALQASERTVIAGVLALIALLAGLDLMIDLREGVTMWQVVAEATKPDAARSR